MSTIISSLRTAETIYRKFSPSYGSTVAGTMWSQCWLVPRLPIELEFYKFNYFPQKSPWSVYFILPLHYSHIKLHWTKSDTFVMTFSWTLSQEVIHQILKPQIGVQVSYFFSHGFRRRYCLVQISTLFNSNTKQWSKTVLLFPVLNFLLLLL